MLLVWLVLFVVVVITLTMEKSLLIPTPSGITISVDLSNLAIYLSAEEEVESSLLLWIIFL